MTRAEILNCLTDRPCEVCKFHSDGHCSAWNCAFEEKPDDAEECEDAINRQAVLDTLDTTDKFMDEERTVENYKALLKECYDALPSVTSKQKKGYLSVDDAMSVFDDYMCGEIDEAGAEIFLEMLKDKAEREDAE